jgi:hypothetical protein
MRNALAPTHVAARGDRSSLANGVRHLQYVISTARPGTREAKLRNDVARERIDYDVIASLYREVVLERRKDLLWTESFSPSSVLARTPYGNVLVHQPSASGSFPQVQDVMIMSILDGVSDGGHPRLLNFGNSVFTTVADDDVEWFRPPAEREGAGPQSDFGHRLRTAGDLSVICSNPFELDVFAGERLGAISLIDRFVRAAGDIESKEEYWRTWSDFRTDLLLHSAQVMWRLRALVAVENVTYRTRLSGGNRVFHPESYHHVISPLLMRVGAMGRAFSEDSHLRGTWEWDMVQAQRARIEDTFREISIHLNHEGRLRRRGVDGAVWELLTLFNPLDHLERTYSYNSEMREMIELVWNDGLLSGPSIPDDTATSAFIDLMMREIGLHGGEVPKRMQVNFDRDQRRLVLSDIEGSAFDAFAYDDPAYGRLVDMAIAYKMGVAFIRDRDDRIVAISIHLPEGSYLLTPHGREEDDDEEDGSEIAI